MKKEKAGSHKIGIVGHVVNMGTILSGKTVVSLVVVALLS